MLVGILEKAAVIQLLPNRTQPNPAQLLDEKTPLFKPASEILRQVFYEKLLKI